MMSRLYILTRLHRINIGICVKTITCRNKTHACICGDAWHTRVAKVTCHQQHMHQDEGKLWHWRHPFGFTLKRSSISRTILPNLCTLRFFTCSFSFIILILFSSSLLLFFHSPLCLPFLLFTLDKLFTHKRFDYKPTLTPMIFSFFTRVYMTHMFERGPFEIAAVIHCGFFEFIYGEFIYETNLWSWFLTCIQHFHGTLCLFFIFLLSLESLTIFSFSFRFLLVLSWSSYASSSMRRFVFHIYACLLHTWLLRDAQYCNITIYGV